MQSNKVIQKFSKKPYNPELEESKDFKDKKSKGLRGNSKFKTQFLKEFHGDSSSNIWG